MSPSAALVGAVRRPPGGGHFLLGLRHASPWVLLLVLVVLVTLAIVLSRRR
ncbi:hypothetical protein ACT8ZV_17240 [Nocardioides sp. MAHUQ-72]|uniref:hypothetical protein n=1 Tax=unclassified Nocardioides TaxID=2615069 RepID=UPI003624573F